MNITIEPVSNRRQLKEFVEFPLELYKGCKNFVPALEGDEYDTFNPKKNGAYDYCESACFLARKDGKVAGRVAAIINHKANELWKENSVRFGWLDFIEDEDVLRSLLDAVAAWGKERGCTSAKGPWGFTDMDKEGLLVEGYDKLSPFTCLYNYPYYDTLLKKIGFEKDVDWTQTVCFIDDEELPMSSFAGLIEKKYGLKVVNCPSTSVMSKRYGMDIFHMYNEAFAPLFQFTPLTDKQIRKYLSTYIPILRPEFVAICVNSDDKPVGFTFCVPSLSKAIQKSRGRLLPFGFIRILHALRHNDTIESLMIGVLPEYQGKGASVLMFKYLHDNFRKFGIKRMILNPQLEENFKVQSLSDQFRTEPFMRRRAYRKAI